VARAVLVYVFDQALRLLHPIMPFITEELWQRLPSHVSDTFLATAQWPSPALRFPKAPGFDVVREAIGAIRQIRAEYAIAPAQKLAGHVVAPAGDALTVLMAERELVARMARCELSTEAYAGGAAAHAVLTSGVELVLSLAGAVDVQKECTKLRGELTGLEKQLLALRSRLANEKFTGKAPPDVVAGERAREQEWSVRQGQLRAKVNALCDD
jgi:valyl-tRNA synthetase